MPDPITSAIVSSVISTAIENAMKPPPYVPPAGIYRMLPVTSHIGMLEPPYLAQWQVKIDDRVYSMSPAIQVRNEYNFMILPAMLSRPLKVRYQTDGGNTVTRIWILSAIELASPENR